MNQRFKPEKTEAMEEFYNILKVGKPAKIHEAGYLELPSVLVSKC